MRQTEAGKVCLENYLTEQRQRKSETGSDNNRDNVRTIMKQTKTEWTGARARAPWHNKIDAETWKV